MSKLTGTPYRHDLKTLTPYFRHIQEGLKTFDVRLNDREFEVGDTLYLMEFDPDTERYTGRICWRLVTYLLEGGQLGILPDYCVLGLRPRE